MAILIYDYYELRERSSKHLKVWKAWHTILFIAAAVVGMLNYVFFQNAMELLDDNCILYPRQLEFQPIETKTYEEITTNYDKEDNSLNGLVIDDNVTESVAVQSIDDVRESGEEQASRDRRDLDDNDSLPVDSDKLIDYVSNGTVIVGKTMQRHMLDLRRSLFGSGCDFAQYMPLMAAVFAIVWTVLFIMCPGGGRVRSGLQRPWRILLPALLFALIMVAVTGYNFAATNGGIKAFCAGFHNVTNDTSCSSTSSHVESSGNGSWALGARLTAARAASAALWAVWAAAAALLLARCFAAPDFYVTKREVYLARDPENKLAPYLVPRSSSMRSSRSSHSRRDTSSVKSDPTTMTTELPSAITTTDLPSTSLGVEITPLASSSPRQLEVTFQEPSDDIEMIEKLSRSQ